jgi:hypothetical protein
MALAVLAHYRRQAWSMVRPPTGALTPDQSARLMAALKQKEFDMPCLA